jgi:formylmethanofuran dehydrogenase subunit E
MLAPFTAAHHTITPCLSGARSWSDLLDQSATRHKQLCPRQVLGVRMGLRGLAWLGLAASADDKRLLVIVETDGCFADGIAAATGCSIGGRTLRVIDHGKVAAVFVDTKTDRAVRLIPSETSRTLAYAYAPLAPSRWHAQLEAYQIMPDEELFTLQPVQLTLLLEKLLSKPGCKARCDQCGEEIINEREVLQADRTLCRACAGDGYWHSV